MQLDENLLNGFSGIRVIPDVHGEFDQFDKYINEAISGKLFVIQLGDLTDFGDKSTECLELALHVVVYPVRPSWTN
tara:strand:- start:993 stop:1220 length:228 start_codon:yes stop_codon:yes gene_type:complete